MKYFLFSFFFLISALCYAQDDELQVAKPDSIRKSLREAPKENPKAPHDWYKLYTLVRDTVYVDTSLTVKSDYKYNYLRKDNFGLLPFANDGQTYNTLAYSYNNYSSLPEFGFKAKQFNFLRASDIQYYSVPTPLTELYFKTVLEQGQSVDAFVTVNTSKNLNFSIAYKGLRSLGKYLNSLSSTGNFRFTSSYASTSKRYILNSHYVSQDFTNQENGGLLNVSDFESEESQFKDRARIDVVLEDAKTVFKGKRYFVDHSFRINKNENTNNVIIEHQLNYETKSYNFKKSSETDYFGDGYVSNNYDDYIKYNSLYNKLGATFSSSVLGKFNVFIENVNCNYFYNRFVVSDNSVVVPNAIGLNLNSIGGKYYYSKGKIKGEALLSKGISKQTFSTLDLSAKFSLNEKNSISGQYQNISKVPDLNYTLYQSDFVNYNWYNSFENEKINSLKIKAQTQWLSAEAQFTLLTDHLYFSNNDVTQTTLNVTPKQYAGNINYLSIKAEKEIKFRKFALDNTILYQKVVQDDDILNVPQFVTRNTLYFSDHVFKKALYLQTGFTFQYFTSYYANSYNPLIAEFYTQNTIKIGGFPMVDFFINGRIRQTRIFLKAEHFNSGFTGNTFYSAPNYPYKDFVVRFGLVWNFFQ